MDEGEIFSRSNTFSTSSNHFCKWDTVDRVLRNFIKSTLVWNQSSFIFSQGRTLSKIDFNSHWNKEVWRSTRRPLLYFDFIINFFFLLNPKILMDANFFSAGVPLPIRQRKRRLSTPAIYIGRRNCVLADEIGERGGSAELPVVRCL